MFILGTKHIPLLETLPENIALFGVLIRSRGMPVGCDSIEPTYNFIRRPFTAISTAPRATTAVEISFMISLFWVTIRRSNQLNYSPALKLLLVTMADVETHVSRRFTAQRSLRTERNGAERAISLKLVQQFCASLKTGKTQWHPDHYS